MVAHPQTLRQLLSPRLPMRLRAFPLAVALLALVPVLPAPIVATAPFADVPSYSEFAEDIQALADDGIVNGIAPGLFGPWQPATRAELAKIVLLASGREVSSSGSNSFVDVPAGAWYAPYIASAAAQGIIGGYGDGSFRPDALVTRAEAAKMVTRAFALPITTEGGPHFGDVPVTHALYSDVESARAASLISGFNDGRFHPDEAIVRAHLAKIVNRARRGIGSGSGRLSFDIDATSRKIANDGVSTVTITVSAKKASGSVDTTYDAKVQFHTSAGTLEDDSSETVSTQFQSGRAQVTLRSSEDEETARITAKVNGATIASLSVEFTTDAPHTNEGRGSSSIAGVGTQRVALYDDEILTATKANPFRTDFSGVAGGAALIDVFVSDSNGDPIDGDTIRATIVTGDGRVESGAFPTTAPSSSTTQRSVNLTNEGRGRYIAWYQAVTPQIPGKVTIEIVNLSTSPALTTSASLRVHAPVLRAQLSQNQLLTRRIGAPTADIRNRAEVLIETLDENGQPVSLATGADTLQARVTNGATGDAYLGTSPANSAVVSANPVLDITSRQIPGLYAIAYTAGSAPGDTTIELRATDVIGQPRVSVKVTTSDPVVRADVTSTTIGAGQTSTILVRVVDKNDVPVIGENLQAVLQSGIGTLTSVASGTGTNVTLDSVPTAPGFYMATLTAPSLVATSQSTQIRITDLSRTTLVQQVLTVQVTPSTSTGSETTLQLTALRTSIGALDTVPVVATLRDSRGTGVSGATARLTSRVVVGSGTTTPIAEIGGGAYVFSYSANRQVGNIRVQVQDNPPSAASIVQEISFNVTDNRITVDPVNDMLLIDDGTGIMVFVTDEDRIPIPGLLNPGFIPPTVGNVTFSNITEIEPAVLGVGSGVYIVGVDSGSLTPPGTVTVRVTQTGAATAPYDSAVLDFQDVGLELVSNPSDDVLATQCLVLLARVTDQVKDPVNGATVQFEIAQGSGHLFTGNESSCPSGAGATRVTTNDSEGSSSTDDEAGVYVATFRASAVEENIRITARVTNSATQVEKTISIRVR